MSENNQQHEDRVFGMTSQELGEKIGKILVWGFILFIFSVFIRFLYFIFYIN